MIERRLHPRLVIRIPGEYQFDGSEEWHQGLVRDISAGGAGLLTPVHISPQTVFSHFRFTLPDEGGPIDMAAMVLRCEPIPPEDETLRYRSGIHFLDLRGEQLQRVRTFVYSRLKETQQEG